MVLVLTLLLCIALPWTTAAMRADHLAQLRRDTVDMFYHGYSNYMEHAFPEDELRPLTCAPLSRDRANPGHIGLNDALGNYSLTLIDSLSTLAILAGGPEDGSHTGQKALGDFQDGIAQFVLHFGDGRQGPSGQGIRARGFDLDSKVQVFETVIRGVGGLLSAHLFAIGELPIRGYSPKPVGVSSSSDDPLELAPIPWANGFKYDGQLLRLALDLSQRLLPAFYTPTGIPYPRVNLRHGIPFYLNSPLHEANAEESMEPEGRREVTETCSAGAGSLTLEFTVLSRLTGDQRFEQAAKRAFWEVWHRRSEIGLIGNGIDAERGQWIGPHSGIGAGMDSFFEYALKSHILLSGHGMPNASTSQRRSTTDWLDPNTLHPPLSAEMHSSDAFLQAWHEAHASVKRHIYTDRNHYPYYSNNHRATGQPYAMWIDSLGAFYPGLLALAGEVEEAIEANLVYTALWTRYAAIPERWSVRENNVEPGIGWWPGRPEFIESTYHIYRATKDPWYLRVGEMVMKDITRRCYTPCGWAGLQDVRTGEKSDRMESFFLGETTKYMYLLFDPEHQLNNLDAAYVFTTEGHPLIIPKSKGSAARLKDYRLKVKSPKKRAAAKAASSSSSLQSYEDGGFRNTCPVSLPAVEPLTGSVTAARPDLFDVSRFTNLYNTPNVNGPIKAIQVEDKDEGTVTRYFATSNHTIFPWTLPPTMLPSNGSCAAPPERVISLIEFPESESSSGGSLLSRLSATSLVWYDHAGPTVKNVDGLRLQLEREEREDIAEHVWRISHVGSTQLGRHETVFFHAEDIRPYKDGVFACVRRRDAVDIQLLLDLPGAKHHQQHNESMPIPEDGNNNNNAAVAAAAAAAATVPIPPPIPSESLLKSFLRAVSSVFEPSYTGLPESSGDLDDGGAIIYSWLALTATGAGAYPVPPTTDTPIPRSPGYSAADPAAGFPWTTIFLAGEACDAPLPDSVPREHHVIVMRRGGCSFAEKLANVPAFIPSRTSLQLVIVVDEAAAGSAASAGQPGGAVLPRPLVSEEQVTPKGMKRLHGIPMVLMGVRSGEYKLFGDALAVGMRRKYRVESQGLVVDNAIVL